MRAPFLIGLIVLISSIQNNAQNLCPNNHFKWVKLKDIDAPTKQKLIKIDRYEYLASKVKNGCEVVVAPTDLDQNGIPGFAFGIMHGSSYCCGTLGCDFEVYEADKKELYYLENDFCGVRPAKGGILTSAGRFVALEAVKEVVNPGTAKSQSQPDKPKEEDCSTKLGAKSAEALAILLLKCLKNNDKATWMRCMHPNDRVEEDAISASKFARHREKLEAEGVTNWASLQFSRLTYPLRPMGGEKVDPGKTVPFATIEVTYKNAEFVGRISIGTFSFCEGRWLVWYSGSPEDDSLVRNAGR